MRPMHLQRFAPSPTGLLHLGHAYSAWVAWNAARAHGGQFLLRMEDLDRPRVRPEYSDAIQTDLSWLGFEWTGSILRQSERAPAYDAALQILLGLGLTYTCLCSRRDIENAVSAPQEGDIPRFGPDGLIYPGTCRGKRHPRQSDGALRLNIAAAIEHLGGATAVDRMSFVETGTPAPDAPIQVVLSARTLIDDVGDIVLVRRDGAVAYHLAVVVDDAHQKITHVTRGEDLFSATPIHRLLQALLELPTPLYHHHALVRDESGKRLAKRDDARAIAAYRAQGFSPDQVIERACANARPRP